MANLQEKPRASRRARPSMIHIVGLVQLLIALTVVAVDGFSPVASRMGSPFLRAFYPPATKSLVTKTRLFAVEEDDDDDEGELDDDNDPLARGVASVSWLPSVEKGSAASSATASDENAEVIPLFPLGGIVYTPNSEHILNIFEPRYRQMYTDILMNGTKRFAVSMSHPTESGRFAQMGVLFQLKDLKEVSERTGDQIKYICSHEVTGRVKLHRILNPEVWENRDTYLRVEGTIIDDSDKEISKAETDDVYGAVVAAIPGSPREEKELKAAFSHLVELQHDLEEAVRFTRASVASLAVKAGAGKDGLWQTIRLWQSFADQRLMARQNELQQDFQERLQDFLKEEKGLKEDELPSMIGMQDLSPSLQQEVKQLQQRMAVELQPLVLESTLTMQKILEGEDHTARLKLVRHFVEAESKRLTTKRSLKGMFSSGQETPKDLILPTDESTDEEKEEEKSPEIPQSLLTDEPDAFQ